MAWSISDVQQSILMADEDECGWQCDVVNCNDWQTGLIPAFLSEQKDPPATVFTIHNLSYDGRYSYTDYKRLGLPDKWWDPDLLEFHGRFSMLKGGMVFSDAVNTVSPNYAREIQTEQFGNGFEGILQSLGDRFSGILNGIDTDVWNPQTDAYIRQHYTCDHALQTNKRANKMDLLQQAGLPQTDAPLMGFIGRMVEQKGIDLLIAILPEIFETTDACMVLLGSGHSDYEDMLLSLADAWPDRLHIYVGYSEEWAHKIEAGCDIFLMPSTFEPCGLNQMYSLHYGTLPIVNNTGGLTDTVVDTTLETLQHRTATGFIMQEEDEANLLSSIHRALELYRNTKLWESVQMNAMQLDFGWHSSAKAYRALYSDIVNRRRAPILTEMPVQTKDDVRVGTQHE